MPAMTNEVAYLVLRIGGVWLQRRFIKGESARGSLRVATALSPTLIFTLVLATIMRERFDIPDALYGGLLIYAAISTWLPSLVLAKPLDFNVQVGPLPASPLRDPRRGDLPV
jgi:Kef-type K+ transport system membrane component KefB